MSVPCVYFIPFLALHSAPSVLAFLFRGLSSLPSSPSLGSFCLSFGLVLLQTLSSLCMCLFVLSMFCVSHVLPKSLCVLRCLVNFVFFFVMLVLYGCVACFCCIVFSLMFLIPFSLLLLSFFSCSVVFFHCVISSSPVIMLSVSLFLPFSCYIFFVCLFLFSLCLCTFLSFVFVCFFLFMFASSFSFLISFSVKLVGLSCKVGGYQAGTSRPATVHKHMDMQTEKLSTIFALAVCDHSDWLEGELLR